MNHTAVTAALGAAILALGVGCQSDAPAHDHATNPALRRIDAPAGANSVDADRAALARLVGVWTFDGSWTGRDGVRHTASGHAAGAIESEHFVLLDVQTTSGELSGRGGRKCGSMLFASEPGIGVTLTAWGDGSASISRLVGSAHGSGSVFTFDEVTTPDNRPRASVTITVETDDRWIAEIRDAAANGGPVVARYQFVRAGG